MNTGLKPRLKSIASLQLRRLLIGVLIGVLLCASSSVYANERAAIEQVIRTYGEAMNQSNVEQVVALFTEDGVFMPSDQETASGHDQIRKAYEHEFHLIDLNVEVIIDEIYHQNDLAYVRSRSKGTLKILAKDISVSTEKYRAFFVLKKRKGKWKIAHFMFNFNAPR